MNPAQALFNDLDTWLKPKWLGVDGVPWLRKSRMSYGKHFTRGDLQGSVQDIEEVQEFHEEFRSWPHGLEELSYENPDRIRRVRKSFDAVRKATEMHMNSAATAVLFLLKSTEYLRVDSKALINNFAIPYLINQGKIKLDYIGRDAVYRSTGKTAAQPKFDISELMGKDISELQSLARDKKNMEAMMDAVRAERIALAKETESALKSKFDKVTSYADPLIGGHVMIHDLSLRGKSMYVYGILVDTAPDLRAGKYKTTAMLSIGAGRDSKPLASKAWSKRPSGKQVGDWVLKIQASAEDKVRKYWKLSSAGLQDNLIVFNQQHPYHNDLSLISEQRRTVIGNGVFDISAKAAYRLLRAGLVDYVEGAFGTEVRLTSKGRRSLDQSLKEFARL